LEVGIGAAAVRASLLVACGFAASAGLRSGAAWILLHWSCREFSSANEAASAMIQVRKSHERGHFNHGWLDTYHTFSFGDYRDPRYMHFRALRVMNEDRVAAGQGFGMHPHRDMEIVTYVLEGELEHRDSMGNGEVLRTGELQRMTAGTGVMHSEFNPSPTEPVHLYQIWLFPEQKGLAPGYEQKAFLEEEKQNRWRVVASRDAREGSLTIHQDADLHLARLERGRRLEYSLRPGRHAWLQVLRGRVDLNGQNLQAGDGAAASDEAMLALEVPEEAEVLLFDLA
jgi:redox-sensitive bicupin YhaK (pirin superfamily)